MAEDGGAQPAPGTRQRQRVALHRFSLPQHHINPHRLRSNIIHTSVDGNANGHIVHAGCRLRQRLHHSTLAADYANACVIQPLPPLRQRRFNHSAQGCEARATLGHPIKHHNPESGCINSVIFQ
jgi:hypothetical protein